MKLKLTPLILLAAWLLGSLAQAQTVTATQATELRADKLPAAPVVASLPAGAALQLISREAGWAEVSWPSPQGLVVGWVRTSAIKIPAGSAALAGLPSGTDNAPLGVRALPPRINRHALIIGISRYADPNTPQLPGAHVDRESATQMAAAMQVPQSNITYLQDDQATGDNIRVAIRELTERVQDGDRVFIHYSGHGTRYNDPAAGGCVEALLAYDGGRSGLLTNREMTSLLQSITTKTDKLFVMYDACHSGGLVNIAPPIRTRGLSNANDEGVLRPKFAALSEECSRPVNIKTRNLLVELNEKGTLPQDIIHISASRNNEVSFDDSAKGGLATQFVRDCMLRDAVDLDKSGAISMDEIRICAQEKINKRMQYDPNFTAQNLTLSGNGGFVPAWFSQAQMASTAGPQLPAGAAATAPARPAAPTPVAIAQPAPPAPAPVAIPPLTGEQALHQMFDQRDAKRRLQVTINKAQLKIGQDALEFSLQSDRAGYVYVALAGSDNKSVYMLFPNDLDKGNKIEAGQVLQLPRPNWRVKAGGPAGTDNLLVLVTDSPRDVTQLTASKAGPFMASLNDTDGRAKLGAFMTTSGTATSAACMSAATRRNNPLCSDAYGAALLSVDEVR